MKPEEIVDNIKAVLGAIENKLGPGKIAKIYVKKTMGPPILVS